jgi:DNA gyrase subunit A
MQLVSEDDDIILISSDGTIIRMNISEISILGRATQGVTLMRMSDGIKVVSLARMINENDDGEEADEEADSEVSPETEE